MILNESVHANTTENCEVIITWTTNYFSTSQVIYASEGESHTLDLSDNTGTPPKYGYAYTTQEYHTSPKVTGHTVTISDLTPLTTYYYRAVSRSSPPAVSRQHSFTTTSCSALEEKKEEEEVEEKVEEKIEEEIFPTPVGEAPEKEEAPEEKEEPIEEEIVEEEIIKEEMVEEKPISLLASLLAAIKFPSCLPWWLILIFTLYPLIKGITALQKSKKEIFLKKDFQKQGIIWLICCLIPIILAISLFLLKYFCVPIWIFLILILATILAWGFVPTSNKDKSSWAVNQQI
ncbi:fibronectin type III domain-containing protein [Candidatus Parcubacteria bacterium]|nr:fibronectin type III domain-containing protein [Candidatus Parcubacteria bacterium]